MKILIIRNYPNYMDLKHTAYNIQEIGLASALIRQGHQCDIVFWTDQEPFDTEYCVQLNSKEQAYIHVYYRNSVTILKNAVFKDIDTIVREYDVIQTGEYNQFQSWLFAKKYNKQLVIYHGQYYGKINRKYNMMCALFDCFGLFRYKKMNTLFITKSMLAKQYLVEKGINASWVHAIGVGLNPQALQYSESAEMPAFCQKVASIKDEIKILYVGNFANRRHLRFLGNVVKRLNEKGHKAKFIIVGGKNSRYGRMAWNYFIDNDIMQYIEYEDKVEQRFMGEIYKKCDYFLFPAEYEIFGMVLLEAMYYEMVTISALNGGSSTLIKDGYNGIVLNERDEEKWTETIIQLEGDKTLKKELGRNARKTIMEGYLWDVLATKFVDVYEMKMKN